ncbi:S24 family peptidase [Caballeronia sp. GAFFF2]|uniref:LexA family transcriptional regulator n=1 Tax=Caballeronia sp. GAFFF2 TaxID=2921741 RepID=UPI0020279D93|nr:S24 family peptidase [Caballeronia sp. GAFFF2]
MLSERLLLAMKAEGISQAELARACGVRPPSVHGWLSGKSKFLRGENLLSAARALKVSQEWLATGKGPMKGQPVRIQADSNTQLLPHDHLPHDDFVLIAQLDISAACGDGRLNEHAEVQGNFVFRRSTLRALGVTEETARIISAVGCSMWPTLHDGCSVLINTADVTPKDGKVFAMCTPEGGLVLKRLIWDYHAAIGAQTWIMRSDNPDKAAHPDKILPPDDRTMLVGRALWNDNFL